MIIGNQRQKLNDADPVIKANVLTVDASSVIHEDDVMGKLRDISRKYNDDLESRANSYADSVLKEGSFATDEDLLGEAKKSLDAVYGEKRSKIAAKTESGVADLNETLQEYRGERAQTQSKLKDRYENAWDDHLEDMAKKGLSHSSVSALSGEALQSAYRDASRELDDEYDRKVKSVEGKIEKLNAAYRDALNGYEISYAIELEDKLNKLKSKRDQMVKAYEKENRSERKQAHDSYLIEEASRNADYEDRTGDYMGEKKENYSERYNYLVGEMEGKSKSRVASFLEKHEKELRQYLGLYYDKFVEEVS